MCLSKCPLINVIFSLQWVGISYLKLCLLFTLYWNESPKKTFKGLQGN